MDPVRDPERLRPSFDGRALAPVLSYDDELGGAVGLTQDSERFGEVEEALVLG